MPGRYRRCVRASLLFVLAAALAQGAWAAIEAVDDEGQVLRLGQPARRIVTLAPHLTEIVFAAGAGAWLVAVAEWSDFPPEARALPKLPAAGAIDVEAVAALQPDLVLAWGSGQAAAYRERLRALGYKVFVAEAQRLDDVPSLVERVGELAGTSGSAQRAARTLRERGRQLEKRYGTRPAVPVFFQVLDSALLTVNTQHVISDVLRRCNGRNVFGDAAVLVPRVEVEAVLAADPAVILMGGEQPLYREWRARWVEFSQLRAVRNDQLHFIAGDLLHRPGPRLYEGAERACALIERARR